ncbi:MAG: glycosyltransferase family 2 protein [Candidatus Bathyarchaeia archaeon]
MNEKFDGQLEVSLVFPAYNEAGRITWAVERAIEALKEVTRSYEIIIAEDGSTDETDKIASSLSRKYPFVRHIHNDKRLGKGKAVREASKKAKGEIIVCMDVDLATNMKHLRELIQAVRDGWDFAIGSRLLPESKTERRISRTIASLAYNFMVRLFFRTGISDHQCGFKAFSRSAFLLILDDWKSEHLFWDTEILVKALRKGFKIKEIPVEWREQGGTKVKLFKDSFKMGFQVFKLWLELKRKR